MKKIIIIDAHSTTLNYLHDCKLNGIEPIAIEVPSIEATKPCKTDYTMFGDKKPKVITAFDDYQKTLEMVRKIKPDLIVPSGEAVLELACRLSEDLKLTTNKWEDMKKVINKFECHKMIKKAGLRYIDGKIVSSDKEITDFFNKHDKKIVIKPVVGTASVGVYICQNDQELNSALQKVKILAKQNAKKNMTFMVQEFTPGAEFVVNTVSCNGVHKVTSLWLYEKQILPGFAPKYERVIFMHPEDPLSNKLIDYVLKVLKAVGIKHGPCHTELVVDAKGPVLIEVNVRIAGASMRWQYLDKVLGHHETDVALMSYMEPKKFLEKDRIFYKPLAYGTVKFIDLPYDIYVIRPTVDERFKHLPSYCCFNLASVHPVENYKYERTIDLDTSGGAVFLANKDPEQLRRDLKFVNMSVKYHIETLFLIDHNK